MTERILIITLSNIGDLVLTTPVMEAAASRFPGTPIDVVADARSSALIAFAPYLGDLYHRRKRAGWMETWSLISRLRQRNYRAVIDLRTPVAAFLLRARQRLVKPRTLVGQQHAVEHHFAALRPLVGQMQPPPCRLYLTEKQRALAREQLAQLPRGALVAIAPGANWPGKVWPVEKFSALLTSLRAEVAAFVVLGSAADKEFGKELSRLEMPLIDLTGKTDLPGAAAVLAECQLFIGNDSGLGHVAAGVGTRALTLFGPGEPWRYRPWGVVHRIILAPGKDLNRLETEPVLELARTMLGETECALPR